MERVHVGKLRWKGREAKVEREEGLWRLIWKGSGAKW